MACINMSNIFEIKRRMRARERRRKRIKNLVIGILVIFLALFLLGLTQRGNSATAYGYDACITLWDLADKYCPNSMDKRDFIEKVRQLNAMSDYKVYANRLYQYPVYKGAER